MSNCIYYSLRGIRNGDGNLVPNFYAETCGQGMKTCFSLKEGEKFACPFYEARKRGKPYLSGNEIHQVFYDDMQ